MLSGVTHYYFFTETPGFDWRLRLGSLTYELEAALVPIVRYLNRIGWDAMVAQEVVLQETLLSYLRGRPEQLRVFGEKSSDPKKRVSLVTFQVIGKSSTEVANKICQNGRLRTHQGITMLRGRHKMCYIWTKMGQSV